MTIPAGVPSGRRPCLIERTQSWSEYEAPSPPTPGVRLGASKDAKGAFKRLFSYFGSQKILLIISSLIIFVSVALSVAGPAVLGKAITDYLERDPNLSLFIREIFVLLTIYAGAWVTEAFTRITLVKVSSNIIFRMRQDAFDHVQELPSLPLSRIP